MGTRLRALRGEDLGKAADVLYSKEEPRLTAGGRLPSKTHEELSGPIRVHFGVVF